jgi:hypothetical protein
VLRLLERLYDLTRAARERTRKALGFELNLPRALLLAGALSGLAASCGC